MRFLFTMHMPSGSSNHLVHQIIADHPAETVPALCETLCEDPFVVVRQWYYEDDRATGERVWIDRGDVVLNTHHIGKVAVHYSQQPEAKAEAVTMRPRERQYARR